MKADEKICPQCAETVKAEAKICRFCGHSFKDDGSPSSDGFPPNKIGKARGKGCLLVLAILVAIIVVGSLLGPGTQTASSSNATTSENVGTSTAGVSGTPETANQVAAAAEKPENAPSVGLFGPQANAARSAQQYLDMAGFSRRGLIEQLSSDAGNGYDVADATVAVDSLKVDWD